MLRATRREDPRDVRLPDPARLLHLDLSRLAD